MLIDRNPFWRNACLIRLHFCKTYVVKAMKETKDFVPADSSRFLSLSDARPNLVSPGRQGSAYGV